MATYTEIVNVTETEQRLIDACARGCYQRALLGGWEAWSGATLKGTAASYGYHYARSRSNLRARLARTGLCVREERREHGRRVVVITGTASQAVAS